MNGTVTATAGRVIDGKRGVKTRWRASISDVVACVIPVENQPQAISPLNTNARVVGDAQVEHGGEDNDQHRELSELAYEWPGPAQQREAVHRRELAHGQVADQLARVAEVPGPGPDAQRSGGSGRGTHASTCARSRSCAGTVVGG